MLTKERVNLIVVFGVCVVCCVYWCFRVAALGVGRDGDLCRRSGACGDTDRTIKCAVAPSGGSGGG